MKDPKFLKPVIISLLLTPIMLLIGILSGGAGHGDYFLAKILFPYTMISTLQFKSITTVFIIIAVIQIPIYGIILGFSSKKGRILISGIVLGIIHIFFVILCLIFINENFS